MGHKKGGLGSILQVVGDVVATATGNPELIPVIHGGTSLATGQGLKGALLNAGLAFAGQEAGGLFNNAIGNGPGNSLTDLFGMTSGAGSLTGPGTIGGDLMGNFSSGSGLDALFNGASTGAGSGLTSDFASGISGEGANPASPSMSGFGGQNTSDLFTNAAREGTSAAAATPSANLSGFTPGTAAGGATGGGTAGGFVSPSFGSDLSGQFAQGITSPGIGTEIGSNVPAGMDFASQLSEGGSKVNSLSDLFNGGGGNMINKLVTSLGTGVLNNPNNKGYNAQIKAGNQIAQDYMPFLNAGTSASNTLADLFGANNPQAQAAAISQFENTPGYQFTKQQGINALDASAAAKGNLLSGNQIKALEDYGSGLASTTYNQYVNNLMNQANRGVEAAGGVGTGRVGAANAQFGKGAAKAANMNQTLANLFSALFPQRGLNFNNGSFSSGDDGLLQLFA